MKQQPQETWEREVEAEIRRQLHEKHILPSTSSSSSPVDMHITDGANANTRSSCQSPSSSPDLDTTDISEDSSIEENSFDEPQRPFLIGVVGIPGSGKSTSAGILKRHLEKEYGTMVLPMDGYHLSKADLAKFPDPEAALYRRGAPDTFDVEAFLMDLCRIKYGSENKIGLPDWDHAVGDPIPNGHLFDRSKHDIVIVEGLYLLHDGDGWESAKDFFNLTIGIHANIDQCVSRLKVRNRVIPGYTPEEIDIRCERIDRANAVIVQKSETRANYLVQSLTSQREDMIF